MFSVTADDVAPNIVILLDNGAEMQQIHWHPDYDNSVDYTPGAGSVFSQGNGYGIIRAGSSYYLVPIQDDLTLGSESDALSIQADSGTTWTINGVTVYLPADPSTAQVNGVIDKGGNFRYSTNYLNWIFYSGNYTGDGSDLPDKSRFYYAKEAMMTVAKFTENKAKIGIYNFDSSHQGGTNVQPLGFMVNEPLAALPANNTLDPNYVNNVNNMGSVTYSPLAEGLASIGGYYASPSSKVVGEYCQKNFVIVLSPGLSSYDNDGNDTSYFPSKQNFADYDADNGGIGEGNIKEDTSVYTIPTNLSGTTWLDDMAHYLYTNDVVGYHTGFQNIMTYTIGFMGDHESNLYLINTSNNGNGNLNLYDTSDPEYGRFHFVAESPDDLSSTLLTAVNDIILRTNIFAAPVVPVTRTTSSNRIYMGFFKPVEGNFWEGNVVKFGISTNMEIVDSAGNLATWPNGAMKEDAIPYWQTKDWADVTKSNYIDNSSRNIYTYLGLSTDLTVSTNAFGSSNTDLTAAILGNPTLTREQIINFIRGADEFDEDADGDISENRAIITGDVLHSEPLVVQYDSSTKVVYFGSNDGMLHAVSDADGSEMWAFIPPDQLHRLKDIVEGLGHKYFVDGSPKVYIEDVDGDGVIESGDGDRVILVCGERKGGTSYFALDVTDPSAPNFLWRINQNDDAAAGTAPPNAGPDVVIPELGQSWSEPRFGVVKTSDTDTSGTHVFFIGGGYSSSNALGKAVLAINVLTGAVVKKFKNDGVNITDMNYSIPSAIYLVDADSNGFVDKLYVGDLGSQMWRFGRFTDSAGTPFVFPDMDENINNWKAQVMFLADPTHTRKFFYPPSVTLERGFDLVSMGTGDREDACSPSGSDRVYAVKDTHAATILQESDLVDVTDPTATPPDLNNPTGDVDTNGQVDQGWYIRLATGEKVLEEGTVLYKVFYLTTYTPNNDPCLPGGEGKFYALQYQTGAAVLTFGGADPTRSVTVGGGIPSKPVTVITETGVKLLISVGTTNPDAQSQSVGAGILTKDPLFPDMNFFYKWWREL
jgi:type IV pilus assembly protein PilY1